MSVNPSDCGINWKDIEKVAKERYDFAADLMKKGHTCVLTKERYPPAISWCHKDVAQCPGQQHK